MRSVWTEVGVIGVDAGCVLLGDPCYWMKEEDYDKYILEAYSKKQSMTHQIKYDMGHKGKGMIISSGYGDGLYPVETKFNKEGRVKEVRIRFIVG